MDDEVYFIQKPFSIQDLAAKIREALESEYGMEKGRVEGPMPAWVYSLRLETGALDPGTTTDLHRRYAGHRSGRACRTTHLDPPLALAYAEELPLPLPCVSAPESQPIRG